MKINNALDRLILFFGIAKLTIHFLTNTNYGFHRDEFLYLDLGNHLGWGFMEVPPFIALVGKISSALGGSIFITRLFPALVGALSIILAGLLVKQLGGKKWAIIFACGGLLFSPAMLGSNTLFQPVSFNQFFWFLSAYLTLRAIQTEQPKYWYFLGASIGIGFLVKYSIVFYGISIVIALLLTPQRKWLATKFPYLALLIAMLIAAPNLFWQYQHNLPVVQHMQELSESQLVHMDWIGFLTAQIQFHFTFSIVWIAGIIGLFYFEELKPYRFLAIGFLLTIFLIGGLSGKSYYTIGAFTILFPFGGIALEKWMKKDYSKFILLLAMLLLTLPAIPYALPVLKMEQMEKYCAYMAENFGLKSQLRWEDGSYHRLPQDYADMNGWEELSERVAKVYHNLPAGKKEKCVIYGGNYGQACSINYYRKKYDLPEAISFSSSCLMWLPEDLNFENQIMVVDGIYLESEWFQEVILVDSIRNPFARDPGYIHYRSVPTLNAAERWKQVVREEKEEFNF